MQRGSRRQRYLFPAFSDIYRQKQPLRFLDTSPDRITDRLRFCFCKPFIKRHQAMYVFGSSRLVVCGRDSPHSNTTPSFACIDGVRRHHNSTTILVYFDGVSRAFFTIKPIFKFDKKVIKVGMVWRHICIACSDMSTTSRPSFPYPVGVVQSNQPCVWLRFGSLHFFFGFFFFREGVVCTLEG